MDENFLTPEQLAERWKVKKTTLSQLRWRGQGPCFTKTIGIRYALSDVEQFEKDKRRRSTSEYNRRQSKRFDILGSKKDDKES